MVEENDSTTYKERDLDDSGDSEESNISRSVDLIAQSKATKNDSARIMRLARAFYESRKMIESSVDLNKHGRQQIRRARRRPKAAGKSE